MSFSASGDPVVEAVRSALSTVEDPELGLDSSRSALSMPSSARAIMCGWCTLTSIGCPLGPVIERDIGEALVGVEGVASVEVQLVFDPPWSPEKMSDEARFLLGLYG